MNEAPVFSEPEVVREVCRASFHQFLREFWDVVVPEQLVENWHIQYLCNVLQRIAERVIQRLPKEHDLLINIPPGTTKSTICSVLFPAWVWTRDPSIRVISASYEHSLALNFSRKSRLVIEDERYQAAFGPIELREDQNTKGFYENTSGGDRKAVGTQGQVTGSHAHIILVDDPINPKEALSEAGLLAVNNWMDETLPSRKVDKALTPTILIMQRLHQNDPTGNMLEKGKQRGKVKHICLPATLDYPVTPPALRIRYENGLLDPVRLSVDVLKEQEADLGALAYAGQYGQQPVPRGGGMFKVERFVMDDMPTPGQFVHVVRYWDKAGTKGGGAWTAGVKMGLTKFGKWWVLDVVRGQWDSGTREQVIVTTAEADGRNVEQSVEQEPGSGGKESAENTVARLAGFVCHVHRPTGDKVQRADPYSVQVNQGNVHLPKGASWVATYVSELLLFPNGKFKDQVDASSGCFSVMSSQFRGQLGSLIPRTRR